MGKQVLSCGPVLGSPAQHSRNKVYKLEHSIVTINFLSHGDQVLFSDELGEFEISYQMSQLCLMRTQLAYLERQNTEIFLFPGREYQVEGPPEAK